LFVELQTFSHFRSERCLSCGFCYLNSGTNNLDCLVELTQRRIRSGERIEGLWIAPTAELTGVLGQCDCLARSTN
jgi:hypothetical protein